MDEFSIRSEEEVLSSVHHSQEEIVQHIRRLREHILAGVPPDQLSQSTSQIQNLLEGLPRLTEQDLANLGSLDSTCSICLTPYLAILAEEETSHALDSPAHPVEDLGVTRLSKSWQCGHMFCRRDISKWIRSARDSCPMCRRKLFVQHTLTESVNDAPNPLVELSALDLEQAFPSILMMAFQRSPSGSAVNGENGENEDTSQLSGMYS